MGFSTQSFQIIIDKVFVTTPMGKQTELAQALCQNLNVTKCSSNIYLSAYPRNELFDSNTHTDRIGMDSFHLELFRISETFSAV